MAGVTHSAWGLPGQPLLDVLQLATGLSTVGSGVGYWNSAGFRERKATAAAAAAGGKAAAHDEKGPADGAAAPPQQADASVKRS